MQKYISKLTPAQEKMMPKWAEKWIKIGLKTGETDWKTFDKYMPICFKKAGLEYPKRIVRVQSPLVGAFAASIAGKILNSDGAVGDAVGGAVGGAVRGAVDDAVDDAVRGAVRDAVGGAVRDAVDGAIDDAVRDAVGGAVGGAVDDAVGDAVRGAVDGAVHGAVRDAVGGAVDDAVGDAVGGAVRGARLNWHYWIGGQFWVGGWYWHGSPSVVSFFTDVCKLKLTKDILERAEAYSKVCQSVNYIWPNKDFVMVCARPTKINKDERGRLHSLKEKSIEYPDNWGLYHISGVRFEEKLWKRITSGKIGPKEVFAIKNTEQRRIAYEQMDKLKMKKLKGYKIEDEVKDDGYGYPMKIISFEVKGFDTPFYYLNCFCPSSGREYFIETREKTCFTAKQKSFGLDVNFDEEF